MHVWYLFGPYYVVLPRLSRHSIILQGPNHTQGFKISDEFEFDTNCSSAILKVRGAALGKNLYHHHRRHSHSPASLLPLNCTIDCETPSIPDSGRVPLSASATQTLEKRLPSCVKELHTQ